MRESRGPEALIEEHLYANPERFGRQVNADRFRWVDRQLRLPRTGVVDLIGMSGPHLYIVEVKARRARGADAAQVLRYREELLAVADTGDKIPAWVTIDPVASVYWQAQPQWLAHPCLVAPEFDGDVERLAGANFMYLIRIDPATGSFECEGWPDDPEWADLAHRLAGKAWVSQWQSARISAILSEWESTQDCRERQFGKDALRSEIRFWAWAKGLGTEGK